MNDGLKFKTKRRTLNQNTQREIRSYEHQFNNNFKFTKIGMHFFTMGY